MAKNQNHGKSGKKGGKRNPQKERAIQEAALAEFGKNGFEDTTISAICKTANISDATLYEYFSSKEELLFSIPGVYTKREMDRLGEIRRYVHDPREQIRVFIQAYLEFYESNPLYTSVVMLTLKGNRKFLQSPSYQIIREASRPIVKAFELGQAQGLFRQDIDGYLVRNMVMGFIEHMTIQWLLLGRPQQLTPFRDIIFDMVIKAIAKPEEDGCLELKVKLNGLPSGLLKGGGRDIG